MFLGWSIADEAIRTGLEHTELLGRSHFLSSEEAEAIGLPGTKILLDGGFVFAFVALKTNATAT